MRCFGIDPVSGTTLVGRARTGPDRCGRTRTTARRHPLAFPAYRGRLLLRFVEVASLACFVILRLGGASMSDPVANPLGGEVGELRGQLVPASPPRGGVAPLDRVGVRTVPGGYAEFFDMVTGKSFVPRGNNYMRLDGKGQHVTFNPGVYDRSRADTALSRMGQDGYNVVRVVLNQEVIGGALTEPGVDPVYMANVADFLDRAKSVGIHAVLTSGVPPPNYGSIAAAAPPPARVKGHNLFLMSQGEIDASRAFWRDVSTWIKIHKPELMSAILSYDIRNEPAFDADEEPFSLHGGLVTPAEGGTYDMSNAVSRQLAADNSAVHWANQVAEAIKGVDPQALAGASLFTPWAVGRRGYDGAQPGANPIVPVRALALARSSLDYVDIHAYLTGRSFSLPDQLGSAEIGLLGAAKPRIMGEFGAYKSAFGRVVYADAIAAASALREQQAASCAYGFRGWLLWTWDTAEQTELWNAIEHEGAIDRVLAPVDRPDPCSLGRRDR